MLNENPTLINNSVDTEILIDKNDISIKDILENNSKNIDIWDKLITITQHLLEVREQNAWQLGDLALYVIETYGKESLRELIKDTGFDNYHTYTLLRYSQVSKAFPKEKRNPALTHRHHMVVQSLPDKESWLIKADDENLSANKLAVIIKDKKVDDEIDIVLPLFLDINEVNILIDLLDNKQIQNQDKLVNIIKKIKELHNKFK